jgi:hypothetical protein
VDGRQVLAVSSVDHLTAQAGRVGRDDLFVRDVDEQPVQFVRLADADRSTWSLYDAAVFRDTVTAESDGGRPQWLVQGTREEHRDLDDAIRSLRRPFSWAREHEEAATWARRLLADGSLRAIDVESTGLEQAYAAQIAAVDRRGTVVFNEHVQPNAVMEPAAVASTATTATPRAANEWLARIRWEDAVWRGLWPVKAVPTATSPSAAAEGWL